MEASLIEVKIKFEADNCERLFTFPVDSIEIVEKVAKNYCIQTSYRLCQKPALYLSTIKTQVTEKMFNWP